MPRVHPLLACSAAVLFTVACTPPAARVCTPGQSVACVGPGGCAGGQVCTPEGSGFGACDCAPSGNGDAGSGGDTDGGSRVCVPGATRCQAGTLFTCNSGGTAETLGTCASGACETTTACLSQACTPGALRCQSGTLFTCNASGTGETSSSCPSTLCLSSVACQAQSCTPGVTRCQSGTLFTCNQNGTAETSGPCASASCQNATDCQPQSCTPGALRCQSGTLFTCNASGTAETSASCPSGSCQTSSACRAQTCSPSATRCTSGTLYTCNVNGTAETSGLCASGSCLSATACQPRSCTPGALRCQTGTLFTCNTSGTGETSQACASATCQDATACLPQTCTPAATRCQATTLLTCNGTGTAETSAACPAPTNGTATCSAGACGFTCGTGYKVCGAACCPLSTVVVSDLVAGCFHTCALTSTGGVKCWGDNTNGQLGDGTTTTRKTPVDVSGLASGVQALTAGCYHTCARTSAGGLKCWGKNSSGQVGDGTLVDRASPVDVTGLPSNVLGASGGGLFTCAVITGGTVKCWGANADGQLGINSLAAKQSPVSVLGLDAGVQAVSAGGNHACALTTGGAVKCWGKGTSGQLGDSTYGDSWTPVDTTGLGAGVQAVRAGSLFSCAQFTGGNLKCWGDGTWGQLGNPYVIGGLSAVPVSVNGLDAGVVSLTPGSDRDHNCAVTTTGAVLCWGRDNSGQLGNAVANTNAWPSPQAVSALASGMQGVTAGAQHSCALTAAGAVKCWGDNTSGQLGDGTTVERHAPVDVLFP